MYLLLSRLHAFSSLNTYSSTSAGRGSPVAPFKTSCKGSGVDVSEDAVTLDLHSAVLKFIDLIELSKL